MSSNARIAEIRGDSVHCWIIKVGEYSPCPGSVEATINMYANNEKIGMLDGVSTGYAQLGKPYQLAV